MTSGTQPFLHLLCLLADQTSRIMPSLLLHLTPTELGSKSPSVSIIFSLKILNLCQLVFFQYYWLCYV